MWEWKKRYSFDMELSENTTEKFCLQVSELLLHNSSKNWNIFIVAEDEFSHIAYREWIARKLNTEHIIIDSTLYYSVENLPVYMDGLSSLVICERTLMNMPDETIREAKTFPISLSLINEDLQEFFKVVSYF